MSTVPSPARWHAELDAHCERYLGQWSAFGEIVPTSAFEITIYAHRAPDRACQTLRTAGVSDYPLHVPAGSAHPRRCELLTYVPATYDPEHGKETDAWPEGMLRLLGEFVHENKTWYVPGHTVLLAEPGEVYVPRTLISAVLFRSPTAESPEFDELEIDGEPCRFLWAYPITAAERSYAVDNGADALRTLIAASAFDLGLQPRRRCLVSGRQP